MCWTIQLHALPRTSVGSAIFHQLPARDAAACDVGLGLAREHALQLEGNPDTP